MKKLNIYHKKSLLLAVIFLLSIIIPKVLNITHIHENISSVVYFPLLILFGATQLTLLSIILGISFGIKRITFRSWSYIVLFGTFLYSLPTTLSYWTIVYAIILVIGITMYPMVSSLSNTYNELFGYYVKGVMKLKEVNKFSTCDVYSRGKLILKVKVRSHAEKEVSCYVLERHEKAIEKMPDAKLKKFLIEVGTYGGHMLPNDLMVKNVKEQNK